MNVYELENLAAKIEYIPILQRKRCLQHKHYLEMKEHRVRYYVRVMRRIRLGCLRSVLATEQQSSTLYDSFWNTDVSIVGIDEKLK